jgi:hypothetical protein
MKPHACAGRYEIPCICREVCIPVPELGGMKPRACAERCETPRLCWEVWNPVPVLEGMKPCAVLGSMKTLCPCYEVWNPVPLLGGMKPRACAGRYEIRVPEGMKGSLWDLSPPLIRRRRRDYKNRNGMELAFFLYRIPILDRMHCQHLVENSLVHCTHCWKIYV